MSKLLKKLRRISKNKSIDEEALLNERAALVDRFNNISEDTELNIILELRSDWRVYNDKIREITQPEIRRKFELYLTKEQHEIQDKIINQSKIYRTRSCSSSVYNKKYGLWEIPHKGQKPVNVKELNERKERYKKFKEDPKNSLEEIRKRRLNDIIHWNSHSKPSICGWDGFYNWLEWFCGDKSTGRGKWYHIEATQEMRDMKKMIPQGYDVGHIKFNNVDNDTLVLLKYSNKRKDYRDETQWKNIIDFIRNHNTKLLIKKIIYCTPTNEYYSHVKIRDKEWKFIENAGCTYIEDKTASYYYDKSVSRWYNGFLYEFSGKLFEINY